MMEMLIINIVVLGFLGVYNLVGNSKSLSFEFSNLNSRPELQVGDLAHP